MGMTFEFGICNYTVEIIYFVFEQKNFLIVGAKMTSRLLVYFFIVANLTMIAIGQIT
jgi:hypothetical protein